MPGSRRRPHSLRLIRRTTQPSRIEKHHDLFEVGDNSFLATAAPTPSHIWLVSASGGAAKRLTSGAWSLSKTAQASSPSSPLSWSPDGKQICFTRQADPHYGDSDETVIEILDVDSEKIRQLTKRTLFEGFGSSRPTAQRSPIGFRVMATSTMRMKSLSPPQRAAKGRMSHAVLTEM